MRHIQFYKSRVCGVMKVNQEEKVMRAVVKVRTAAVVAVAAMLVGAVAPAQAVNPDAELNVIGQLRATDQYNWDTTAWWWKTGPDSFGMESLTRGDLQKGPRGSNEYPFAQ